MKKLLATVGLAILLAGCQPTEQPPTNQPIPSPANIEYEITFVLEVINNNQVVHRIAQLTAAAYQADGTMAVRIDPSLGPIKEKYQVGVRSTHRHTVTIGSEGVVAASVSYFVFGYLGDIVTCYVEKNGLELAEMHDDTEITYVPPGHTYGTAIVNCYYGA